MESAARSAGKRIGATLAVMKAGAYHHGYRERSPSCPSRLGCPRDVTGSTDCVRPSRHARVLMASSNRRPDHLDKHNGQGATG